MTPARIPRLELQDIVSTYEEAGQHLIALDGLSLTVGKAEFVALVGPSGSGKSTLLDIVAGLITPDSGAVRLNGEATTAKQRLGQSAYMQQRDLLLPWRTTIGNAALGLEASGMSRVRSRAQAAAELWRFGLDGFGDVYPAQLSGGMRQRAAFLRTILPRKELVLFDEPFGALDALTRSDLQVWLAGLWEQERSSVLLVTHDVEEAVFLADRVVVLTPRPGRVAFELSVSLPRPRTRAMIASPEFIRDRATLLPALGLLATASMNAGRPPAASGLGFAAPLDRRDRGRLGDRGSCLGRAAVAPAGAERRRAIPGRGSRHPAAECTGDLSEVLIGFACAVIAGVGLGIAVYRSPTLDRALYPIIIASQTIPIPALAPLLLVWFGYGLVPKVVVTALVGFFPIVVNTVEGLRSTDRDVVNLLRSFGASRGKVFRLAEFPSSLPSIFAGRASPSPSASLARSLASWSAPEPGSAI